MRVSISILTLPLIARYFGVSDEKDAWILATAIYSTIGLAIWGPINETFRTKFVTMKELEGETIALSRTASLIGFIFFLTTIVSILIFLYREQLAYYIDPNASVLRHNLISLLLYLLIPSLLLNQLSSIGTSILNAYDVYIVPEIAGSIASVCNLLLIIYLVPLIGVYALVISQYIGVIFLLLAILYFIKKINISISYFSTIKWKELRFFLIFALPFFLPYFSGQISLIIEKWLANSLGNGKVSTLDYARQFGMLVQGIISSVLATIMIPNLSKKFAQRDQLGLFKAINDSLSTTFVALSITTTFLIGSSFPLTHFFFDQGNLTNFQLNEISLLMSLYGFALIAVVLYLFFGYLLLSTEKGKVYAFWGVIAQILVIVINIVFVNYFGIFIFPISFGVAHFIIAIVLFFYADDRYKFKLLKSVLVKSGVVLIISLLLYVLNINIKLNSPFLIISINSLFVVILIILFSNLLELNFKRIFKII
jgi:putative peptidoglycan lipid II flippase